MNNKPTPSLDVVVPTCRVTPLLLETVDSAATAMNEAGLEKLVIVVNGGSESQRVCDDLGKWLSATSIPSTVCVETVISHPHRILPLYENWNFAVQHSQADLVHLLHDDDLVSRFYYREIKRLAQDFPDLGLYATAGATFDSNGRHVMFPHRIRGEWAEAAEALAHGNMLLNPSVVIRREAFEPFDTSLQFVGDWKTWFVMALNCGLALSPEVLAFYRIGHSNATLKLHQQGLGIPEVVRIERELCAQLSSVKGVEHHPTGLFAANIAYGSARQFASMGSVKLAFRQLLVASRIRKSFPQQLGVIRTVIQAMIHKADLARDTTRNLHT